MKYKISKTKHIFAVSLLVLAIQAALIYAITYYKDSIHISLIFISHLLVIAALTFFIYKKYKNHYDITFYFLLLIMTASASAFGSALTLLVLFFCQIGKKRIEDFDEWFKELFLVEDDEENLYERLENDLEDLNSKNNIISFSDIIKYGDDNQKCLVLSKITLYFKSEFAPLLLMAVKDASNPIRVQAATAIVKIQGDYNKKILTLEKKAHRFLESKEQGKKNKKDKVTTLFELGKLYEDYANCGLLNEKDADILKLKALEYYDKYHLYVKDDPKSFFALGRFYLKEEQLSKAYKILKLAIDKPQADENNIKWCFMECLYGLKKFDELKEFAKKYSPLVDKDDHNLYLTYQMLNLWKN